MGALAIAAALATLTRSALVLVYPLSALAALVMGAVDLAVLLTDGENNAGKVPPKTAAEAVKALNIHFYAIGAGINGIAPAPIYTSHGPLTDAEGNIMYQNQQVEFNETGLREIAQIANGKFFRATDTSSLENIYRDIDRLEKSTVSVKKYQEYRDLFPACIMGAVGLLLGQILLSQTIWKKLP